MAESRFGLLGWPLTGSLSPRIHSAFLLSSGLTGSYSLLPVGPGELREAVSRLFDEGWSGLNVTIPHKTEAAGLCGGLSEDAAAVGAVNTLVRSGTGWLGHNTDTEGFSRAFIESGLPGPLLVVGCGGAARAVVRAAGLMGLETILFCRRPDRAQVRELSGLEGAIADLGSGTLVNATPLGWRDSDEFPAPSRLPAGFAFFDLNYNPSWSYRLALSAGGCRTVTGERMLVSQAALSFRAWTGLAADEDAALRVLESMKRRNQE